MNNNFGLTLLELLLSIAIISILAIVASPFLSTDIGKNQLETSTWEVIDTLRRAQNKAMNAENNDVWSVHLEATQAVLFQGSTYNPVDPNNFATVLPNRLTLGNISLNGGGSDITFTKIKGKTSQYGSFTLTDTSSNEFNTITVSKKGKLDF